jgi:hypothetical protein
VTNKDVKFSTAQFQKKSDMMRFSKRRFAIVGLACGLVAASASTASAQILDRVFGGNRDSGTRAEGQTIDRNYGHQDDRGDYRSGDGRTYRGGIDNRSGTPYRGDAEYRGGTESRTGTQYRGKAEYRSGDRIQTRTVSQARRGTTLIGSTVRIEGGQSLGRVDDIVIGESGCVDFMVVSVSGLRGMTGKLAVLPFAAGEADFARRTVYVDWAEADLRRAPIFFSSSRWPDFTDTSWSGDVFAYFDLDSHDSHRGRAYGESRDSDRDMRGSERGRFDDRSSRDRDSRDGEFDRDSDNRSSRGQDSRTRQGSDRSSERDSGDRDQNRSRSDSRSRTQSDSDDDSDQSSDRSSRSGQSRDRSSDRDRSNGSQDPDRDSSNRSRNNESSNEGNSNPDPSN